MGINKLQHSRLLFIDRKIRSGGYPNAASLAKEYEVSARTISRDIEYMRDSLQAPIEFDTHHNGYYYTEKNFFLPALDIRESDFFAICITEKALKQYENTPLYEKLSSVFNRLKEYLPESIRVNTTWIDTKYTFMQESFTDIMPEVWETVSSGLRQSRQLELLHRKAGAAEPVKRVVDPYHIVNYRGEWYLVGLCHRRNEVLRFAMSRIRSVSLLDTEYLIPHDFEFSAFMGSNFGIMTGETEYPVSIEFSEAQAPYILERQWQSGQEITQNSDGTVILSFKTNSLFELKRWVLSWGSDARVLSPELLKNEIAEEIEKLGKLYRIV